MHSTRRCSCHGEEMLFFPSDGFYRCRIKRNKAKREEYARRAFAYTIYDMRRRAAERVQLLKELNGT